MGSAPISTMNHRQISPDATIDLTITTYAWVLRKCVVCQKMKLPSERGTDSHRYQCSKCNCRVYCSEACQDFDLEHHREFCSKIVKSMENIKIAAEQLDEEIGEARDSSGIDIYEDCEIPRYIDEGRKYLKQIYKNMALLHKEKLEKQINDEPSEILCALLVENCLDILAIMRKWSLKVIDPTTLIEFLLGLDTILGGHSKMYSACKYFARRGSITALYTGTITGDLQVIVDQPLSGAPCLDQDDNLSESTDALDLSNIHLNLSALFKIYCLKFWLFEKTKFLQQFDRHILKNADCTSLVGEYLGVRSTWWQVSNADKYLKQAKEILSAINQYDKSYFASKAKDPNADEIFIGNSYFYYFGNNFKEENESVPRNLTLETQRLDLFIAKGERHLRYHFQYVVGFIAELYGHVTMSEVDIENTPINSILQIYENVYNDLPPGRSIEKDMFEGGFQIEEEIGRAYFHRQKHSSEVRSFFAQIDIDSSQIWPTKDRQFNSEGSAWDAANEMRAIVLVLLQNYLLSEENLNLCFGTNATFVKFYKLSSLCRNRMVVSTAQSTC